MASLILKDAIIQKKSFLYAVLYGLFILLVFSSGGGGLETGAYIMGIVASTYLFIQTGLVIDDKNKTELVFNSLPINRKEIVLAKYISSFLASLVNLLIITVIGLLLSTVFVEKIRIISYSDIIISLASVWLLIALYLPFYFRFGYIKTKIFNMFFFFLFFFGPTVLVSLITENPHHPISRAGASLITEHSLSFLGGTVFVGIVFLLISLAVSFKFYEDKEF